MSIRHRKPSNSAAPRTLHNIAEAEHHMTGPGVLGRSAAGSGPVEVLPLPGGGDWTYVFLDTAAINSTVTRADTALAFTPSANSRYEVEVRLYVQSAATTTGARPGIRWPTSDVLQKRGLAAFAEQRHRIQFAFLGTTALAEVGATGVAVANEEFWAGGWAMFRTGASPAGDFIITLASEIAASEARIMENSFIRYRTI